nr:paraneoplastic antigen Ma6E-like [Aegilops tauschii subsp. strangulata]
MGAHEHADGLCRRAGERGRWTWTRPAGAATRSGEAGHDAGRAAAGEAAQQQSRERAAWAGARASAWDGVGARGTRASGAAAAAAWARAGRAWRTDGAGAGGGVEGARWSSRKQRRPELKTMRERGGGGRGRGHGGADARHGREMKEGKLTGPIDDLIGRWFVN